MTDKVLIVLEKVLNECDECEEGNDDILYHYTNFLHVRIYHAHPNLKEDLETSDLAGVVACAKEFRTDASVLPTVFAGLMATDKFPADIWDPINEFFASRLSIAEEVIAKKCAKQVVMPLDCVSDDN